MIRYYKGSMAGDYHVKQNIPCQDSSYVVMRHDNVVFAAVADGLGSVRFSDIGSRIASCVAVEYCKENLKSMTDEAVAKKVLNNAFVHAYKAVIEEAGRAGNEVSEYDTTLCLAVYDGEKLFYGQAGDSGMVALLTKGEYVKVTEQQQDDDGYVYPLSFGPDYWVFGMVTEPVSAVMLMTDGIWDQLCPKIMAQGEVKIYRALAKAFMDRGEDDSYEVSRLGRKAYEYWENYPVEVLNDDKTFVVVYNPQNRAKQLDSTYYALPDWDELNRRAREKLYEQPDETQKTNPISDKNESPPPDRGNDSENDKQGEQTKITPSDKKPGLLHRVFSVGYHTLALLLLIAVSSMASLCSTLVQEYYQISYGAIFVICLLANASVLFPAPSLMVVFQYALILNPVTVAFFGALGASVGEMIGYLAGFHGRYVVDGKWIEVIRDRFLKNPYLIVFAASAVPLPVFDIVGVLSGAANLNKRKFYMACLAGKIVKMLTVALMAEKLTAIIT